MTIQKDEKEVIERAEWVAIATAGLTGPHLVATWADYVRTLGIEKGRLLIPAGQYQQTEQNIKNGSHVELLFATRQVQGEYGPGRGCHIRGTAEFKTKGPEAEQVKGHFPWARGVLIVNIQEIALQL